MNTKADENIDETIKDSYFSENSLKTIHNFGYNLQGFWDKKKRDESQNLTKTSQQKLLSGRRNGVRYIGSRCPLEFVLSERSNVPVTRNLRFLLNLNILIYSNWIRTWARLYL